MPLQKIRLAVAHTALFFALLLLAVPAMAADITPEGAQKLKTVMDEFIATQKKLAEIDGQTKLEYEGNVVVEQADGFYAITLPHTKIKYPEGRQFDIGMVSINATPHDTPGQWKMRLAIPTPMIALDAGGAESFRLSIGGQQAAGLWDETLQNFVKLDGQYKDIAISGPEGLIKIPDTQIRYDFTQDAQGLWSGPGNILLNGLEAEIKETRTRASIQQIKLGFSIDKYSAPAIKSYREKMAALSESIAANGAPEHKKVVSPQHARGMANMIVEFTTKAGDGMKLRYDLTGVQIARTDEKAQIIKIASGFLGMDTAGFLAGNVAFGLQAGYNGFSITPLDKEFEGITPDHANIDIALKNIPLNQIVDLGMNTLDSTMQNPEMGQMAGMSLLFKLPAILAQAGTYMTVSKTSIGNAEHEVTIEGQAKADVAAVTSVTAEGKSTFRGLDALLARITKQAQNPESKNAQKFQDMMQNLQAYKDKARIDNAPDGQPLHIIDFVMDKTGQTLFNGKPALAPQTPAPAP